LSLQVAREKPQFAEITVNTESSSGPATLLALFIKNVKPDSITIGWRPPSDPYVEIQMYEVCMNLLEGLALNDGIPSFCNRRTERRHCITIKVTFLGYSRLGGGVW
jgi:hypothetical protein